MPLLFDMPFEQLESYQGTNPRPDDFDTFWDVALEEMRAVTPNVELVPADFQTNFADCYHMYFTGCAGRANPRQAAETQKAPNPPTLLL